MAERSGIAVNLTLDREARELLRKYAQSAGTQGDYLSRLIHADAARREERARVQAILRAHGAKTEVLQEIERALG
jgi:hypothetical protein